ncbi:MAG: Holliday junction resolvase RuvX [Clostridia bacterium]|nr:Holliday junction resolvase RuvX [Clostridia bacterium]
MIEGNAHGKYLGVDYGDVRTGLAVSDISGFLAGGIGQVSPGGMRHTAQYVAAEAKKQGVVRIIVGLPKNMDGSEGFRAEAVRAFVELLKAETDIPIDFSDERLSTCEAHRYLQGTGTGGKKRKNVVDTLSAQIILQDYLDREKNRQNF